MRIRFAEFVVDTGTRELLRRGEPVHIPPKAFSLLQVLLERSPNALSKEALHDHLWPKVFVSSSALATMVAQLRQALGDDSDTPRFIRTIYGFGYAFAGTAEKEPAPASTRGTVYRLVWARREIELHEGENLLGRSRGAVVWIEAPTVSRQHARITIADAAAVLEDLGSKHGTFLKGQRIDRPSSLVDGDEIKLGHVRLIFRSFADRSTESTLV